MHQDVGRAVAMISSAQREEQFFRAEIASFSISIFPMDFNCKTQTPITPTRSLSVHETSSFTSDLTHQYRLPYIDSGGYVDNVTTQTRNGVQHDQKVIISILSQHHDQRSQAMSARLTPRERACLMNVLQFIPVLKSSAPSENGFAQEIQTMLVSVRFAYRDSLVSFELRPCLAIVLHDCMRK